MSWLIYNHTPDENSPECLSDLCSLTSTNSETNISCELGSLKEKLGVNHPENYIKGYMYPYFDSRWNAWMKKYESQTCIHFKSCSGAGVNKCHEKGVVEIDGKKYEYSVLWRKIYNCSRGNKPRQRKILSEPTKPRNCPGSRLMDCKAIINVHLMKLDSGGELLQVSIPKPSAHCNHSIHSLADMMSHKPLPEIEDKLNDLVQHSHLNQMSLSLALKHWINQELIPQHLKDGILTEFPHKFDRRYFPTTEDIKNISRKSINKLRKNSFDQDALELFLREESARQSGLQYFLRKYSIEKQDAGER